MVGASLIAVAAVAAFVVGRWERPEKRGLPSTLQPGSAAGYNVLLITLDTTRADRLGCYGYEQAETPVLDALARDGVRFADAVAPVPMTLPSHATMLTGLDPPRHGIRDNGRYVLAETQTTMAELLEGKGYDTAAFVSAFVLDARFGLGQGFGVYDANVGMRRGTTAGPIEERSAAAVTDAAAAWLRGRDLGKPFFAWVHYFDPHYPYRAPEPYVSRHPGEPYDAEIAFMDAEIGRLLDVVDELGLRDETLLLVAGDHGDALGDHGEPNHGFFIYESTMRVPLLLSARGLFRETHVVDDAVVSLADLAPTILELLGVEPGPPMDGVSLLAAGRQPDRAIYLENLKPHLDFGWAPLYGLRRHTDKYILAPEPEYYDLRADPAELRNLVSTDSADRDRLADRLEEMLASGPALDGAVAGVMTLDPETRARLESLGYLGGAPVASEGEQRDPKEMLPYYVMVNEAIGFGSSGRAAEALALLEKVALVSPRSCSVLDQLGQIQVALRRFDDAEATLRRRLDLRRDPDSLTLLAQLLVQAGRLGEAEWLAAEALDLEPGNGTAFIVRGDVAAKQGRFDDARREYATALRVDPHRATFGVESRLKWLESLRARRPGS